MGYYSVPLRFKLAYALHFAGFGVFYPYLALYLHRQGLSGGQIGTIMGMMPLLSFLVQPVWGLLSDVYGMRRSALVAACLGVAASSAMYTVADSFMAIFLLTAVLSVMRGPIAPLSDALALEHLDTTSRREHYGTLRLWGSFGFALSSLLTGALVIGARIGYIVPLFSLIMLVLGLVAVTLPDAKEIRTVTWLEGATLLRRTPTLAGFFLGAIFVGTTVGAVHQYLIIYLDDMNASGWISGIAFSLSALFEVPLMAVAARFIRRWGLRWMLIGGIAVLPARWLMYTIIDDPMLVLPTQILHSIAMTSLLVGGVLYVDRQLSPEWRATGQALYQASLQGIGASIGIFGAGIIYGYAGIVTVWWACVVTGVIGTLITIHSLRVPAFVTVPEGRDAPVREEATP